jgi:hypothetical protein
MSGFRSLQGERPQFSRCCDLIIDDGETGTASLVLVPHEKRIRLKEKLSEAHVVSIYAFKREPKTPKTPPTL